MINIFQNKNLLAIKNKLKNHIRILILVLLIKNLLIYHISYNL